MDFNYNRIDKDGRLMSYYGAFQEWEFAERGKRRTIKVEHFFATESGVQYYFVSLDGKFSETRMSVARLHYFLNSKQAVEIKAGRLYRMPLLLDEVKAYFSDFRNEKDDCPFCGGTGINDDGEICRCAIDRISDIKEYNAELRLKELIPNKCVR